MYSYDHFFNYSDYGSSAWSVVGMVIVAYLIVLAVAAAIWIIEFIFYGIALNTLAKRMGHSNPWLAFVPFGRNYLHGNLAGSISIGDRTISDPGIWYMVIPIISGAVTGTISSILSVVMGVFAGPAALFVVVYVIVFAVSFVIGAVLRVLAVLINFQILERFTSRNMAVAHSVLSCFVPFYQTICLFVMRNKEFLPGKEPEITPPPTYYGGPADPVPPPQQEQTQGMGYSSQSDRGVGVPPKPQQTTQGIGFPSQSEQGAGAPPQQEQPHDTGVPNNPE